MLLVAVGGTHVVQVAVDQFAFLTPLVAAFYVVHHARGVAVVHRAEHTERGQFAGTLRRQALVDEFLLLCQRSLADEVGVFRFRSRRHLNGLGDELQAGVGNVAQLSADLHHDVDARTA